MTQEFSPPIPILRIFDEAKAVAFYVGYLGFKIDWQHRFDDGMPLYLQVSKQACVLHLSEHHGDSCPGSSLRIATVGLEAFQRQLSQKNYPYLNPAIERMPWGTNDLALKDPFGNRLIFTEDAGDSR